MAVLAKVYVVHTTSTKSGSNTDDSFALLVPATGKQDTADGFIKKLDFPHQPHDNRERGRTDYYEFDVGGLGVEHKEARGKFAIETKGKDAWLPSSIWILGKLKNGRYRILGASPQWPSGKRFSQDSGEGRASHAIPIEL